MLVSMLLTVVWLCTCGFATSLNVRVSVGQFLCTVVECSTVLCFIIVPSCSDLFTMVILFSFVMWLSERKVDGLRKFWLIRMLMNVLLVSTVVLLLCSLCSFSVFLSEFGAI